MNKVLRFLILAALLLGLLSSTSAPPAKAQTAFSCTDVTEIPQLECEALVALHSDRSFLTKGDVFSDDQIDAYIELKWEEVMRWETTPSPVEFDMYYSS